MPLLARFEQPLRFEIVQFGAHAVAVVGELVGVGDILPDVGIGQTTIEALELRVDLAHPLDGVPDVLSGYNLTLEGDGHCLIYDYDTSAERTGITTLLAALAEAGIRLKDISTRQSSLEDIFVEIVGAGR